jgi:hypothetical protein
MVEAKRLMVVICCSRGNLTIDLHNMHGLMVGKAIILQELGIEWCVDFVC